MIVEIKNISKSFGKKPVLKDINLVANSGEILCLLGPSGAGKTTLIRIITGALKADKGEVMVDGIKVPSISVIRNIGFMPQGDAVYNDISGFDNMMFFGRLYGLSRQKLQEKVQKALDLVNLSEDKNKLVLNYSGGMKKRLSLAIALLHEPQVLILDEPTVGIDPVLRKGIWDQFELLRKQGKTIIVSTHVMDEAERCQRAALIYGGKLIANGEIQKLKEQTQNGTIEELFFKAEGTGV